MITFYLTSSPGGKLLKINTHLTKDGIEKLLAIKNLINKGITPELKLAFPHTDFNKNLLPLNTVQAWYGRLGG